MGMEKRRLRCPTCAKLYEVNEADIISHNPHFDCISCATRFTINHEFTATGEMQAQVVFKNLNLERGLLFQKALESQSLDALRRDIEGGAKEKSSLSCPKCGAIRERSALECFSCHVIFARLEDLPLKPTLKAQPSLVRKWKDLILDFDNKALHEDFIKCCREIEALPFAILKYEELRKAQGGSDDVCASMIARIHGMLSVTLSSKPKPELRARGGMASPVVSWHKYVFLIPISISILMILMGFLSLSLRNLVGAGVAMMLLTFGLILFWKGRISLSDFV